MDDSVPSADVTRLLHEWQNGDRAALDQLVPRVYDELRAIASRHRRREWRDGAMQTTALVNEAYLEADRSTTGRLAETAHTSSRWRRS